MFTGQFTFAQLMAYLPRYEFAQCVQCYQGNRRVLRLRCWDQFLIMAFAQLTARESLRDLETCLRALSGHLYHAGLRAPPARSTLAQPRLAVILLCSHRFKAISSIITDPCINN